MEDPYSPPKAEVTQRRAYKTPIIVPISVGMVLLIYTGYWLFHINAGQETGLFASLKNIAFETFLMCEVCLISIILYGKKKIANFLHEHPKIENRIALEKLKPIARENMYSALVLIFLLGLGSLAAIMTLLNYGLIKCVLVAGLSVATALLIRTYNPLEEKIKQIECTDTSLEKELSDILNCWMNKPFPNF